MSTTTERKKRRQAPPDSPVFEFKFKRSRAAKETSAPVVKDEEPKLEDKDQKVESSSAPVVPEEIESSGDVHQGEFIVPSLKLTRSDLKKIVACVSADGTAGAPPLEKLKSSLEELGKLQPDYFDSGRRKKRVPKDAATRLLKEQVIGLLNEFTASVGSCSALQTVFKERRNPKNGQLAKKEARLQASIDSLEKEVAEWEQIRDSGLEVPSFSTEETKELEPASEEKGADQVDLFSFYEKLSGIRTAVQQAQRTEVEANDQREKVFVLYESGVHRRDYLDASNQEVSVECDSDPRRIIQNLVAA